MAARRVPDEETHVRVAVRIRPLNSKELVKGSKICLKKVINQPQSKRCTFLLNLFTYIMCLFKLQLPSNQGNPSRLILSFLRWNLEVNCMNMLSSIQLARF